MWLGVAVRLNVVAQISFARSQPALSQSSAKQLVSQPDPVRVYDVGFAVCGDFGYTPLANVLLNVSPSDAVGLARGIVPLDVEIEGRRCSP